MDEAVSRAHACADAGADAILIHSRKSTADDILICECLADSIANRDHPKKNYRTPVSAYRDARISTVIWANHSMRAAIVAVHRVCGRIMAKEGIASIEPHIATLDEVFALLGYDKLIRANALYLQPNKGNGFLCTRRSACNSSSLCSTEAKTRDKLISPSEAIQHRS
ncbi:isocitrate lyase/phosphoenolpyruvate mutase family protein [Bradyrhizobium sp. Ec3.3]|uniref:isocitrate lyase/phosphoenolpyruvate mutase family protein n=1 Tax=Bradyrhizobium sp. Ec3.3 TaxID=189753 RepID=UPI0007C47338